MSTLRELLQNYLAMRRDLGFKLKSEGTSLLTFIDFMEREQATFISIECALTWAKMPTSVQSARWAQRLSYVRVFARYCRQFDPRTEIPPTALLPFHHHRPTPYFFTDEDIDLLLRRAIEQPAKDGFTHHTLYCLLGLLIVTGLRIYEALNLTIDDVDLDQAVLTISSTKFGKSRLVPLHQSTVDVLRAYRQQREQFLAGHNEIYWFMSEPGKRLKYDRVLYTFHRLTADLPMQPGRSRPRLHDFRHHFAMATILHWYRDGQDVERSLPVLSAFLGHVEVTDTYWYLSACPELLDAAKDRMEQRWEKLS